MKTKLTVNEIASRVRKHSRVINIPTQKVVPNKKKKNDRRSWKKDLYIDHSSKL